MAKTSKTSDLTPDPNNANKGTPRGRGMLENSLTKLGAGRSILVDRNGVVIAGNKTLETAAESGFEDTIVVETTGEKLVVVKRTDLDLETDAKARELAIADNRVGEVSLNWDAPVLLELDKTVDLAPYFSDDELQLILDTDELPDLSHPKEEQDPSPGLLDKLESGEIEPRVKLGEVWKLGRHYIACCDSTVEENVKALLKHVGDRAPSMVWSDAPYGISIQDDSGHIGGGNIAAVGKYAPIIGDKTTQTAERASELYLRLLPQAIQCWWGANHFSHCFSASPCWIVWDKENTGDFADAELAWVNQPTAVRIFRHMWNGLMKASEKGQKRVHPTQKPVALFEWFAQKYGNDDDLILDPFLGSGISVIGSQQLPGDRIVVGCELSPDYCEVVCQRFESLTGITPELAGHI